MAKIPGIAYIIIGGVVAGFSAYVNYYRGNQSMAVFMYIGIAFAIIGVGKIVFKIMTREGREKKGKTQKHTINTAHQQQHTQHHSNNQNSQHQNYQHPHIQHNYNTQHTQSNQAQNPHHHTQNHNQHHTQNHNQHQASQQTTHQSQNHTSHQQQNSAHHPQHTPRQDIFPQHKVCPNCNGKNHLHANFCMRCGNRLH